MPSATEFCSQPVSTRGVAPRSRGHRKRAYSSPVPEHEAAALPEGTLTAERRRLQKTWNRHPPMRCLPDVTEDPLVMLLTSEGNRRQVSNPDYRPLRQQRCANRFDEL